MAGKKKEVVLQVPVNNDEQWGEMLATKGLIVVDVYQKWCGPCRAIISLFKKIKNDLGDDLLSFTIAEADSIEALEKYRGKCEPTFLFYAGGQLVAVVKGANPPLLQKTIIEELTKEKKVLDDGMQRITMQDVELLDEEAQEEGETQDDLKTKESPAEMESVQVSSPPSSTELQDNVEPKSEEAETGTSAPLNPEIAESQTEPSEEPLDLPKEKEDGDTEAETETSAPLNPETTESQTVPSEEPLPLPQKEDGDTEAETETSAPVNPETAESQTVPSEEPLNLPEEKEDGDTEAETGTSAPLNPETTESQTASSEEPLDLPEEKEDGDTGEQEEEETLTSDLQEQNTDRVEES